MGEYLLQIYRIEGPKEVVRWWNQDKEARGKKTESGYDENETKDRECGEVSGGYHRHCSTFE